MSQIQSETQHSTHSSDKVIMRCETSFKLKTSEMSDCNYYFLIPGCFGFIPTISSKTKEILDLQLTVKLLVADAEQEKINSSEENVDQVVLCWGQLRA